MFPLQPSDELVFGTPTTSQLYQIPDDLIVDHSLMESNLISFATSSNHRQRGQKTNFGFRQKQTESKYECKFGKAVHRDSERRRRQEMSNLCDSLRSLLPRDHIIKGKSSVCDLMHEAVNYIKQKQKNIQELRIRRDKLKQASNLSGTDVASSNGGDDLPSCVKVNLVPDGLEILISRSIRNPDLRLSQVLAELEKRELDVVNCVSTSTKGGYLHNIQVEAKHMTSLDVLILQDGLSNAIE